MAAVDFTRTVNAVVSIRGGDHNAAETPVCDGGLMIDLSLMKAISVDAAARLARAEPGLRWAEFDRATQEHGLATPGEHGQTPASPVSPLGGIGWVSGR